VPRLRVVCISMFEKGRGHVPLELEASLYIKCCMVNIVKTGIELKVYRVWGVIGKSASRETTERTSTDVHGQLRLARSVDRVA
jgi:hypothetical protein